MLVFKLTVFLQNHRCAYTLAILLLASPFSYGGEPYHVYTDKQRFGEEVWTLSTNGYASGIRLDSFGKNRFDFEVFVRRDNVFSWVKTNILEGPMYLGAPNNFCGPIELRYWSTNIVPLLKPEVNSSNSYPQTESWMWLRDRGGSSMGSGPIPGSFGLFGDKTREATARLGYFELNKYFQLTNSGDYQFTVWPKMYLRSATNTDLYERIDLPPVTVTIRSDGEPRETSEH
jgi:hypothetical protein